MAGPEPPATPLPTTAREPIGPRIATTLLELGLLALAWHLLGLDELLVGAIAPVIVVANAVPTRWSSLTTAGGLLALAGLVHFHYGATPPAVLLAALGLVALLVGVRQARERPGPEGRGVRGVR